MKFLNDENMLISDAYDRVRAGQPMPGVIALRLLTGVEAQAADLSVMIGASTPDDFENQVQYIPIS